MTFWNKDLLHLTVTIILAAIASGFIGHFLYLLLIICIAFILRQAFLLNQLEQWLKSGAKSNYPASNGLWEEIYYHIFRLKKANKKRKKQLSRIIEQFRKSTAALPDAVVLLGENDEISWFNDAAKQILSLKKRDLGQRIPNLIRSPAFIDFLGKKEANAILSIKAPANDKVTLQIKIVTYDQGAHLLVAHDVTFLNNIERMRKDFVDNISHELRTPLTVLKGYLETLEDMDDDHSPLLTHSLHQMNNQTLRMQHLVDDLLLLANLETQKTKSHCVEINPLLKQICQESSALEQLNSRIELFIDSDINILGNDQELRSAFSNLIVNALKYSPEESIITVQWHQAGQSVILDIADLGEGIPELEIPKITERFYRSNAQREHEQHGTGLGLAIVKHTLSRHDAELKITSELGKGSCFSCVFPRKRFC
ncbi:phosphate regulon sensor histidine kinase PhoR [Methylococcaceae bacterium HT1]|nr:phosphate regulon sensor histidine kinase PhoR [Methylococcaceae bacterium HT1]TXL17883.1 phosphate regulon sensor histidine kinase PhoR [Methylococcaceae bacterium HT3]TXL22449.1 phosphate regulon sensor histidine kinase PhoR [Methylococcaceae bacterium HT2]